MIDLELMVLELVEKRNPINLEQRQAILRYLAACPHAADTVEGVMNWWLPLQRYKDTHEAIEKVLEELAAEGRVAKTKLPDNKVIYTCLDIIKNSDS